MINLFAATSKRSIRILSTGSFALSSSKRSVVTHICNDKPEMIRLGWLVVVSTRFRYMSTSAFSQSIRLLTGNRMLRYSLKETIISTVFLSNAYTCSSISSQSTSRDR